MDQTICPRCGRTLVGERFYGPCSMCRTVLRQTVHGHVFRQPEEEQ